MVGNSLIGFLINSLIFCERKSKRAIKTEQFLLKKIRKNCIFCMFLTVFPLFIQRVNRFRHSSLSCSFFKDRPWVNRSGPSEQKSDRERFTPVALYKRATEINSLRLLMTKKQQERFALFHERIVLLLFCSFALSLTKNKGNWKTNEPIPSSAFFTWFKLSLLFCVYFC